MGKKGKPLGIDIGGSGIKVPRSTSRPVTWPGRV